MAKTIYLKAEDIESKVHMNISIIGKRASNEKKSPFSGVTLSSVESGIIANLASDALMSIVAGLSPLATNPMVDEGNFQFEYNGNGRDDSLSNSITYLAMEYVVSYILAEYFSMFYTDYAETYVSKRNDALQRLIDIAYAKQPPAKSDKDITDVGEYKKPEQEESTTTE